MAYFKSYLAAGTNPIGNIPTKEYICERQKSPYETSLALHPSVEAIFQSTRFYGSEMLHVYLSRNIMVVVCRGRFGTVGPLYATLVLDICEKTSTIRLDKVTADKWIVKMKTGEIFDDIHSTTYFDVFKSTIRFGIKHFFGLDWKLVLDRPPYELSYSLATLRNQVPARDLQFANTFMNLFKSVELNTCSIPLNKTVGLFRPNKEFAATMIQKWYKGWKIRLAYRFDPSNGLGKLVIMRMFTSV